jgi:hypothetical protein
MRNKNSQKDEFWKFCLPKDEFGILILLHVIEAAENNTCH